MNFPTLNCHYIFLLHVSSYFETIHHHLVVGREASDPKHALHEHYPACGEVVTPIFCLASKVLDHCMQGGSVFVVICCLRERKGKGEALLSDERDNEKDKIDWIIPKVEVRT